MASFKRPIKTVYYCDEAVVKTTRSKHPVKASQNMLGHLRKNSYAATHAECYDLTTGKLYSVLKLHVDGNIEVIFRVRFAGEE